MKQAMIFAAGLGTRLKPITDTMPKALVPVGGQPLLWHVVQKLKAAGFGRIVVNVHHFAQQIVDYLQANENFGLDIRISDESEQLLETGGGIKKALPLFDPESPILIHNVDILSNADLSTIYAYAEKATTLVVSWRETQRYLLFDDQLHLQGWTNIKTGEVRGPAAQLSPLTSHFSSLTSHLSSLRSLAFSGIHVLHPSLFPLMKEWPDRFPIMDFYLQTCGQQPILGYEAKDLRLLDVGKLDTLHEAEEFLKI